MTKLRLELNYECNYNCKFCHHDQVIKCENRDTLTADDYAFLTKTAKEHCGINQVTLSGGEPILRKDINNIIAAIANNKIFLKLTTNGYFLDRINNINNLNAISVSLHSLQYSNYQTITGTKTALPQVIDNLYTLHQQQPSTKLYINMVAIKDISITFENLKKMLDFCAENNMTLKIIELLDPTSPDFISLAKIESIIEGFGFKVYNTLRNKIYLTNSSVDVILQRCFCPFAKDVENPDEFCHEYNDLFVLPNGKVQICRQSSTLIDLYCAIKNRDEIQLANLINYCKDSLGKNCAHKKHHL